MKKYIFILFIIFIAGSAAYAQDKKYNKKGNCFCDHITKHKGGWYLSFTFTPGMNFYAGDVKNENKTSFAPGLKFGTNISDNISIQAGVDYYALRKLNRDEFYPRGDFTYLDIPISFIFRIPNDRNGIVPYVGLSAINNLHLRQHYYFDPDNGMNETVSGISYNTFYAGLHAGSYFVLSDKLSFFAEARFLQSMAAIGKTESVDNYVNQIGLSAGFNIHF